jgi:hypothetical protein
LLSPEGSASLPVRKCDLCAGCLNNVGGDVKHLPELVEERVREVGKVGRIEPSGGWQRMRCQIPVIEAVVVVVVMVVVMSSGGGGGGVR